MWGGIDPWNHRLGPWFVGDAKIDMEAFLLRGLDLILPVSGATLTLSRGATLAVRWLHEPQPTSNLGWGFHTRRVVSIRAISVFVSGLLDS